MKAVMYHYVREPDSAFPEFKFLHLNDFKKQLDYFQTEFEILHPLALNEFGNNHKQKKQGIILTFDDGVKDHYRYVMPELLKRNLSAIFYVPTGMYNNKKVLGVHRIHLLLGKFGGETVYNYLVHCISNEMLTHEHIEEFRNYTYISQVNDAYTEKVKRILNYFIGYEYREKVLDNLMNHFFADEEKLVDEFYILPAEIKEMCKAGFVIGSHTVTHPVMSKLAEEEQLVEIKDSFNFLQQYTADNSVKTFCYPYGGFHSFTKYTENILQQEGCNYSFNVEPRDIDINDLKNRPQALPRYDCNLFPNGSIWIN